MHDVARNVLKFSYLAASMERKETESNGHQSSEAPDNKSAGTENEKTLTFTVYPKIPEIFVGKTVLVTGATGFLGKVRLLIH